MTAPTVAVTVKLADFGGPALAGVKITARPSGIDYTADGTFVGSEPVTAVTDVNGVAILNVFPNALSPTGLGTLGTTVRFTASLKGSRGLDVQAFVPNTPCNLVNVLASDEPPPALDAATAAVLQAQSAASEANDSATQAQQVLAAANAVAADLPNVDAVAAMLPSINLIAATTIDGGTPSTDYAGLMTVDGGTP